MEQATGEIDVLMEAGGVRKQTERPIARRVTEICNTTR